jgi:acyl carrier protein
MTPGEISAKLRAFFEDSYPHQGMELTDSTDLLNGWFVDSLGIILTVVFLEKQFGVDVKPADVNGVNFHSIESLVKYVAMRTGGE